MQILSALCVSEKAICQHSLFYRFKLTEMSLSVFLRHHFKCSPRFICDYDYTTFNIRLVTQRWY
jgi:hypothetical protein